MKTANNLSKVLATRSINLVYRGGSLGLIGVIGSSKVLGIIPKVLAKKKITGSTLSNELQVANMHERMTNMIYNVDTFIALPGGFEILEEVFNIAS